MVQCSLVNNYEKKGAAMMPLFESLQIRHFMAPSELCSKPQRAPQSFEKLIMDGAGCLEGIASMLFQCLQAVTMDKDIPINISQHWKEIRVSY